MPVISTNTAANAAILNLNKNSAAQETYLQQISSGSRINKSSDDAAGLAVSGQLTSDITTLGQSAKNAQQAEALLQTADGALARQSDILQRMKSLATQYNSGTVDDESRNFINAEYQQLMTELDLVADSTEFNGRNLVDGTFDQNFIVGIQAQDNINVNLTGVNITTTNLSLSSSLFESDTMIANADSLTVTATGDTAQGDTLVADTGFGAGPVTIANASGGLNVSVTIAATDTFSDLVNNINAADPSLRATFENGELRIYLADTTVVDADSNGTVDDTLTVGGGITANASTDFGTAGTVYDNLAVIDSAIQTVSEARSKVGAYTSAMEYQGENIDTQIENLTGAKSTIVDADIAEAQSNFTSAQVLTEAATAALAQANQLKTSLLTLLR